MSGGSIASSSSLVVPGISSSRGWRRAERVVEEVPPSILWTEPDSDRFTRAVPSSSLSSSSSLVPQKRSEEACSVCRQHQSRYTCPRCKAPYCSVECYKNHTGGGGSQKELASMCTEAFFKSRVSSILNLEARERKGSTQRMLNQLHQQNVLEHNDDDDEVTDLSDQLYHLLQLLDEKQDHNLSEEELMAMLPIELRASFQRDIQEGKVQDLVLERWHPWWRRQLVSSEVDSTSRSPPAPSSKPLDERLLQVPKFSTIFRKEQSFEILLFHSIDILYSFCWTIRLYHGLPNVIIPSTQSTNWDGDASLAVDAAATFIQHSAVLNNNDTRFTSLEQVLSACTAASTKVFPDGCNAMWSVLVEDCALLLDSHRLVGRALLEANDLLKASIQGLKHEDQSSPDKTNKDHIVRLRQLRKKVEFFLSWSQHAKSKLNNSVKSDLLEWVRQWKSDEFSADTNGNPTCDLVDLDIPESPGFKGTPTKKHSSPLLIEVATTPFLSNEASC